MCLLDWEKLVVKNNSFNSSWAPNAPSDGTSGEAQLPFEINKALKTHVATGVVTPGRFHLKIGRGTELNKKKLNISGDCVEDLRSFFLFVAGSMCVQSIELNHVYLYVYIRVWAGYITHKYSYLFHHFLWCYHILFCLLNFFRGQSPWDIKHKLKWCQEDCPGDPMNPAPDDITKFTWKDRRKAGIIVPKQPFHVEN